MIGGGQFAVPHPSFFIKIMFFNKKVITDVISVVTFLIKNDEQGESFLIKIRHSSVQTWSKD
jgi:hypothetical protein